MFQRKILNFVVTQFLTAFNDNYFKNILVVILTFKLNRDGLIPLATGVFIVPFFLFSGFSGQIADKFSKTAVMQIVKFSEILLSFLGGIGIYFESPLILFSTLFGFGLHSAFFGALKYSIIPELVSEHQLVHLNGLVESSTFIGIILGTILGGVLAIYNINFAVMFLIMISLLGYLSSLFISKTKAIEPGLQLSFIHETVSMIKHVSHPLLLKPILGISWFWFLGTILIAELPAITKDVLAAEPTIMTLFLTIFAIGIIAGAISCQKLMKGLINATYVPFGALGMCIFCFDLYGALNNFPLGVSTTNLLNFLQMPKGWRIIFDLFMISFSSGIYLVPLNVLLQTRSLPSHRARNIAASNIINAFFMALASLITTVLIYFNNKATTIMFLTGIVAIFVTIIVIKLIPGGLVRSCLQIILKFIFRVEVEGLENLKKISGRCVIVANHQSYLDGLLIASFIPEDLTFVVHRMQFKKWWVRIILKFVKTIPISSQNPIVLKDLIKMAKNNEKLVIFPEGRITMTGSLMKIYSGPAIIADNAQAMILPVRIDGASYTKFSHLKLKLKTKFFPKITLHILPPRKIEVPESIKGNERHKKLTMALYDIMSNMIFESGNYHQTLFRSLLDAKKIYGGQHIILEDIKREPLSINQLILRSFVLSKTLPKNQNIGIILPNMCETMVLFFALHINKCTPAMLNFTSGIKNVLHSCGIADIKIIYTSRLFVTKAKLEKMIESLKDAKIEIIFLETIDIKFRNKISGFIAKIFSSMVYRQDDPKHSAVILFTSGSEGAPKGVVLSHENIQANLLQILARIDFNSSDKVFNVLPIFHAFGLTAGTLMPILSGVKCFLYHTPFDYRLIPELVYDTDSTIIFATDTFLRGYAKYANSYDFYATRYIFAGAEKVREETQRQWSERFGLRLYEGYGATETAPVIAVNSSMYHKSGTVGRLLPAIEYKIEAISGIDVGGELIVRGPNIMKGYLDKGGKLIPFSDSWYRTGDVASIDEEGFLKIIGRLKRFAKIGGEMIDLTSVEQHIYDVWPNHMHAIINISNQNMGEKIILYTTNPQGTLEEIMNYFRHEGLPDIAIPKSLVFKEELPLLGTGKINYVKLKEEYAKNND